MADPHRNDYPDLRELARAVRELSARVQRLERRLDDELGDRSSRLDAQDASRIPTPISNPHTSLESRIGSQWLNRIGVVAVLFGVAYLLRYLLLSNWISAVTWIWLGVGSGIAVIAGSEWFRRRGYRVLSLSLKATGIGVIYLSLWAALELYSVLTAPQVFAALMIITTSGAVLALRESSEVLLGLALIGGFLTPVLISMPSREAPLFSYLGMLDAAAAAVALKRDWWKLVPLAFIGTVLLFTTWYFEHYSGAQLWTMIAASSVYFVIFCAATAWSRQRRSSAPGPSLAVIEVVNPAIYFGALWLLLGRVHHNALAIPALILSALYFGFAWKTERRDGFRATRLAMTNGGLGIAFIAVALAILLQPDWLSLGWFLEAAIIIGIGFWKDLPWLRWGALLLLCAAVVKAFAYDVWQLSLGYRTLSFVALGILLLVISFAYQRYGFSMIFRTGKGSSGRLR